MTSAVSFAFLQAEELIWCSLLAVTAIGYGGYYLREVVKVRVLPAADSQQQY